MSLKNKLKKSLKKPWIKWPLRLVGVVVVLGLVGYGTFTTMFIPSVPTADYPEPANETEAYRQDLEFLKGYADVEKAFEDPAKKARFIAFINHAMDDLEGMTPAKFELLVSRAVALGENGHTNVSPISRTRRYNHFPIRTGPFEDGHFVLQATTEHADLLGAEILAIEGTPIRDVADAFVDTFGGVEHRSRFMAHLLILSPELLHAEGFSASPEASDLTLKLANGDVVERRLEGSILGDNRRHPWGREVMEYQVPKPDTADWVHLMQADTAPHYLAQPEDPYLYRRIQDGAGAYVKINFNWDVRGWVLTDWLDGVMDDMRANSPAFAVVDVRFNGGGTDATAAFAKALPELVVNNGPIYVLTSHETFSAALGAVAQFKEFGGARTTIIGSPAGDNLRFIANGGVPYVLPNSKLSARVWSTWEDYENGCWEWSECFWFSPYFRHPGVGSIAPDIHVPTVFSDYAEGRDALLEAALEHFSAVRIASAQADNRAD